MKKNTLRRKTFPHYSIIIFHRRRLRFELINPLSPIRVLKISNLDEFGQ